MVQLRLAPVNFVFEALGFEAGQTGLNSVPRRITTPAASTACETSCRVNLFARREKTRKKCRKAQKHQKDDFDYTTSYDIIFKLKHLQRERLTGAWTFARHIGKRFYAAPEKKRKRRIYLCANAGELLSLIVNVTSQGHSRRASEIPFVETGGRGKEVN